MTAGVEKGKKALLVKLFYFNYGEYVLACGGKQISVLPCNTFSSAINTCCLVLVYIISFDNIATNTATYL